VRNGEVSDLVGDYGHLIVDECHHLSAVSFELVARRSKARYVLGLSATVARKDGHHPIIFMQCGPIRYRVDAKSQAATRSFSLDKSGVPLCRRMGQGIARICAREQIARCMGPGLDPLARFARERRRDDELERSLVLNQRGRIWQPRGLRSRRRAAAALSLLVGCDPRAAPGGGPLTDGPQDGKQNCYSV
jgi:hypothetical protein